MEFVGAGLGDNSDLADRRELGGVVGQVHAHFLERLDVVAKRAGLRVVHAVGKSSPVDGPVVLVDPAARETGHAAAVLPLQSRRQV